MKAIVVITLCAFFSIQLYAQDKIILESGDTLKVVIGNRDKKNIDYVIYDDPEMSKSTMPVTKVSKIQFDNGKIIDFRKSKYPGAYVGLYVSAPIPVSSFANDDSRGNNQSGYAKSGKGSIALEGRISLYKFIGLHSSVSYGAFNVNEIVYFDQLNTNAQNDTSIKYNVSGRLGTYQYGTFSLGADLGFKWGSRVMFFVPIEAALMGIKIRHGDEIDYISKSNPNVKTEVIQRTSSGFGGGFGVGLRLEVRVNRHISIGAMLKMNNFNVKNNVKQTYTPANFTSDYTWKQNVTYTQIGLSLHYHFKN